MLSGSQSLQLHAGALVALLTRCSQSFKLGFNHRPALHKLALLIALAGFAGHRLVINQIKPVQPIVLRRCCLGVAEVKTSWFHLLETVAAEGYC